jgi:hypothetical protein
MIAHYIRGYTKLISSHNTRFYYHDLLCVLCMKYTRVTHNFEHISFRIFDSRNCSLEMSVQCDMKSGIKLLNVSNFGFLLVPYFTESSNLTLWTFCEVPHRAKT